MKVRLITIAEETQGVPVPATAAQTAQVTQTAQPASRIVAYLRESYLTSSQDVPPLGYPHFGFSVPYEMIEGAQIGDEFTVHLERVRK